MHIIITGASRGIGLELVKQGLQQNHHILAIVRDAKKSTALQELVTLYPQYLGICETDINDPESANKIAAAQAWDHVDLLINNAGVLCQGETYEDFLHSFQTNTIAPFLITKALLPTLKKSVQAKVVHITSRMGSISDNTGGGYYAYRASKSALNMINKSLTQDNPWLTTLLIHPGWVKTEMGGHNATVEISDSARGIWQVINQASITQSGQFFDFRGEPIAW